MAAKKSKLCIEPGAKLCCFTSRYGVVRMLRKALGNRYDFSCTPRARSGIAVAAHVSNVRGKQNITRRVAEHVCERALTPAPDLRLRHATCDGSLHTGFTQDVRQVCTEGHGHGNLKFLVR